MPTQALFQTLRYRDRPAWVRSWIEPGEGHLVVISDLTKVEMVSVLAQRRREGAITAGDFALLQNAFLLHVDTQYRAIGIQGAGAPPAGCSHVKDARCDSADMCFIIFNQPVTLARADQNLLAAAAAEGLTTEDPDSHP